jgi:hypothetical protein
MVNIDLNSDEIHYLRKQIQINRLQDESVKYFVGFIMGIIVLITVALIIYQIIGITIIALYRLYEYINRRIARRTKLIVKN